MSAAKDPEYLGDGVYASFDGYYVVLTTGHHDPAHADNTVFLDLSVVAALERYVAALRASFPPQ